MLLVNLLVADFHAYGCKDNKLKALMTVLCKVKIIRNHRSRVP